MTLTYPQGEEGSGTATPTTAAADDLDFSDLKKKKKKKKAAFDLEAFEKELSESKAKDEEEDVDEVGGEPDGRHLDDVNEEDLGEDVFAQSHEAPAGTDSQSQNEPWLSSDRDYTYQEVSPKIHTCIRCTHATWQLLQRFYAQLHASNPALFSSSTKRYTIAPPQIMREGNKKTIFANIPDICKRMHRQPEHVIQFMFAEMGTTGSVDGSGRLVIKGRFQQKQIENVLRRYIGMISHLPSCPPPRDLC